MKPGTPLTYRDAYGEGHTAVVEQVVGTGPSGYKRVDVALTDGRRFSEVPYRADAQGGPCWTFDGPEPEKPEEAPRRGRKPRPAREDPEE